MICFFSRLLTFVIARGFGPPPANRALCTSSYQNWRDALFRCGRLVGMALTCCVTVAAGADGVPRSNSKGYRLVSRDMIRITIHGEPDLSVERRIDGDGNVSLPLIGSLLLQGLAVPAAEEKIRATYLAENILMRPQVAITVLEYVAREVSILGQVNSPGKVIFPIEVGTISVVDAISKAGGFTRLAKGESVRITRTSESGTEESLLVNVEGMIDGKGKIPAFRLLPGDVVFVPERLF